MITILYLSNYQCLFFLNFNYSLSVKLSLFIFLSMFIFPFTNCSLVQVYFVKTIKQYFANQNTFKVRMTITNRITLYLENQSLKCSNILLQIAMLLFFYFVCVCVCVCVCLCVWLSLSFYLCFYVVVILNCTN
jgi:hypothetical protein